MHNFGKTQSLRIPFKLLGLIIKRPTHFNKVASFSSLPVIPLVADIDSTAESRGVIPDTASEPHNHYLMVCYVH
jgi:hypothetical protein